MSTLSDLQKRANATLGTSKKTNTETTEVQRTTSTLDELQERAAVTLQSAYEQQQAGLQDFNSFVKTVNDYRSSIAGFNDRPSSNWAQDIDDFANAEIGIKNNIGKAREYLERNRYMLGDQYFEMSKFLDESENQKSFAEVLSQFGSREEWDKNVSVNNLADTARELQEDQEKVNQLYNNYLYSQSHEDWMVHQIAANKLREKNAAFEKSVAEHEKKYGKLLEDEEQEQPKQPLKLWGENDKEAVTDPEALAKQLELAKQQRDRLWQAYQSNGNPDVYTDYLRYDKKVQRLQEGLDTGYVEKSGLLTFADRAFNAADSVLHKTIASIDELPDRIVDFAIKLPYANLADSIAMDIEREDPEAAKEIRQAAQKIREGTGQISSSNREIIDAANKEMQEALEGRGIIDNFLIQQVASAAGMYLDLAMMGASGAMGLAGTTKSLTFMGIRSASESMVDQLDKGRSTFEAVTVGAAIGSLEVLSEKLFGGNPIYDDDKGFVNKLVEKVTRNPYILKAMYSSGFDIFSEGLEEVFTEILDPIAEGLLTAEDIDWASASDIGNAFLGGMFMALTGKAAEFTGEAFSGELAQGIKTRRAFNETAFEIVSNADNSTLAMQEVINQGLRAVERSDAWVNAKILDNQLRNGKTLTVKQIGEQLTLNAEAFETGLLRQGIPEEKTDAIVVEQNEDGTQEFTPATITEEGVEKKAMPSNDLLQAKVSAAAQGMDVQVIGTEKMLQNVTVNAAEAEQPEGIAWAGTETEEMNNGRTEETGIRGDEGRNRDNGAAGRTGEPERRTKRTAIDRARARAGEANRAQAAAEAVGAEYVTLKEAGFESGSDDLVRVLPKEAYTPEVKKAADIAEANGLEFVPVVGVMRTATGTRINAVLSDGKIFARADSTIQTVEESVKHETFHARAAKDPTLTRRVSRFLKQYSSQEETQKIIDRYSENYTEAYADFGLTDEELEERIWEEVLADAYADYSRYEAEGTEVSAPDYVTRAQKRAEAVNESKRQNAPPVSEAVQKAVENGQAVNAGEEVRYSLEEEEYAPKFYSKMGRVVDAVKQEKLGAASVVSMLRGKGVKAEEIKWSGIEQWLEGKKSVTKAELQEFIRNNTLQMEEVTLSENEIPYTAEQQERIAQYERERDDKVADLKKQWKETYGHEIRIRDVNDRIDWEVASAFAEEDRQNIWEKKIKNKLRAYDEENEEIKNELKTLWESVYGEELALKDQEWEAAEIVIRMMIDEAEMEHKVSSRQAIEMEKARENLYYVLNGERFKYETIYEAMKAATNDPIGFANVNNVNQEQIRALRRFASAEENLRNVFFASRQERMDLIAAASDIEDRTKRLKEAKQELADFDAAEIAYTNWMHPMTEEIVKNIFREMSMEKQRLERIAEDAEKINNEIRDVKKEHYAENEKYQPKWVDYSIRGGKNYRELLFRLPGSDYTNDAMEAHWGDTAAAGGVIAHARISDVTLKNGERTLFVDEIQSDWHNKGDMAPDAPYKNSYQEFVMKNLLRMAAENDYDSISWTTGKMQENRWSSEYAEGYRIEYDQEIPSFLKKYGKQWGGVVNQFDNDGTVMWHFAIPNAMRQSVLYEGQPLYSLEEEENVSRPARLLNSDISKLLKKWGYASDSWIKNMRQNEIEEFVQEFETTGEVDEDKIADLLFRAYFESYRKDATMVEEYGEAKKRIQSTKLFVPESVASSIPDFKIWKRDANAKRMKISEKEGSGIDTFYEELKAEYPGLLPDYDNQTDQLLALREAMDRIRISEEHAADISNKEEKDFFDNEALPKFTDEVYEALNKYTERAAAEEKRKKKQQKQQEEQVEAPEPTETETEDWYETAEEREDRLARRKATAERTTRTDRTGESPREEFARNAEEIVWGQQQEVEGFRQEQNPPEGWDQAEPEEIVWGQQGEVEGYRPEYEPVPEDEYTGKTVTGEQSEVEGFFPKPEPKQEPAPKEEYGNVHDWITKVWLGEMTPEEYDRRRQEHPELEEQEPTTEEAAQRDDRRKELDLPQDMTLEEKEKLNALWQARAADQVVGKEHTSVEDMIIRKADYTATPAIDALGIKVDGSVANYKKAQMLVQRQRAAKQTAGVLNKYIMRMQPTDAERTLAGLIAEGSINASYLNTENVNVPLVLELADYMMAANSFKTDMLSMQRQNINAINDELADTMFPMDGKDTGILNMKFIMNERTPERVVKSMFGEEQGQKIFDTFFRPVWNNGAEMYRFKQEMFDKVREFEDSTGRKRELTKDERAVAQQLLESKPAVAAYNALEADLRERIDAIIEDVKKKKDFWDAAKEQNVRDEYVLGVAQQYADYLEAKESSNNMDKTMLENAVNGYSEQYNMLYAAINDFLCAHGYEPIGFIKGYAPHFQRQEIQTTLDKIMVAMGVQKEGEGTVSTLPTEIAGKTADFKPNMKWQPNFQTRRGKQTTYDIADGFERYINNISQMFYHADDVMRIRAAEKAFRRRFSSKELSAAIEDARQDATKSTQWKTNFLIGKNMLDATGELSEEKINAAWQAYVDGLYEDAKTPTRFAEFTTWLDNYANLLAGKQSLADRGMEHEGGRVLLNIGNKLMRAFSNANVAGNVSSALNQTAQIPLINAELGGKYVRDAIKDIMSGQIRKDDFVLRSNFLTEKAGVDILTENNYDRFISKLFAGAEFVDTTVSTIAVRGAYLKSLAESKTAEQAMQEADDFGRRVMGSRMKGVKPQGFESKKFTSKMIHVFQVECSNTFDHMFVSDMPQAIKKVRQEKGATAAAKFAAAIVTKFLLGSFVLNRITDDLYGGSPAPFDLIGYLLTFVAGGFKDTDRGTLMQLTDNCVEGLGGERIFGTDKWEGKHFKIGNAWDNLSYNVSNDVPYVSNLAGVLGLGDKTLPTVGINEIKKTLDDIPDAIAEKMSDEDGGITWAGTAGRIAEDVLLAGTQFLPGGRQVKKTYQGTKTMLQGADVSGYGDGQTIKYTVDQNPWNWIRAGLFGKAALAENDEFYAQGKTKLSVKQTQVVKTLDAGFGIDRQITYDMYQDFREMAKTMKGADLSSAKRDYISDLDLTDEQKYEMYRAVFMDPTAKKYDEKSQQIRDMMDTGLSWRYITDAMNLKAYLEADEEMKAAERAQDFAVWLDEQNWTAAQEAAAKEYFTFWTSIQVEAGSYDRYTEVGLSSESAEKVSNALREMEDGLNQYQKLERIRGLCKEDEDLAAAQATLSDSAYLRMTTAMDFGVSMDSYLAVWEKLDKGKPTQAEVTAVLDKLSMPDKQKAVIWQCVTNSKAGKNNPYSQSIGDDVALALKAG